jgi:choline dehydrogenase
MPQIVESADVCIVGAGAAGCVLANRLSAEEGRRVVVIEAGPDYGPVSPATWPADLLDASDCATSHDWGYGVDTCARVVGGCSAHNGCLVVWGTPACYDAWAEATGDPAFGFAAIAPRLAAAQRQIRARTFAPDEVGAFTRRALDGWAALGEPLLDDINAPDAVRGAGLIPVNRVRRTRWSAAAAYLDPARDRPNLTIVADALATRIAVRDGRAIGVDTDRGRVEAPLVVLAAGAYGTPALLLRSGIGPATDLAALGIPVVADNAEVGCGLEDHPARHVRLPLDPDLAADLAADDARGVLTHVQALLKTPTFQLLPNTGWLPGGRHQISLIPVVLGAAMRGTVTLRSADPAEPPAIGRAAASADLATLADGAEAAQALAATITRRPAVADDDVFTLYHPASTCRIGAVADTTGRVHGVEGIHVADAAAMPSLPRANTHLSTLALADLLAERLALI